MYSKQIIIRSMLVATVSTGSVAFAEGNIKKATETTKTATYDLLETDITAIEFEKGDAALLESEASDLRSLVKAVKDDAEVQNVVVAAWSDKEFPATKNQTLSDADRKLADKRATSVKTALKNMGIGKIETHSMAEHPGWLAKTFNTKDAQIKGEGKIKDANDQVVDQVGRKLREEGGPGKVVVFLRRAGHFSH